MAFNWVNINNNEIAGSVRSKLNSLGTNYASDSINIDNLSSGINTINSELATINGKLQTLNSMVGIALNVSCPSSQWVEDTDKTYTNFPYKVDLFVQGTTSDMSPIVNFAPVDQESGNYIGAQSSTNVITIWGKEIPETDFVIPNIILIQEVYV